MENLTNPVFIIDGSYFLFRAYHSIRETINTKGVSINAIYGFCHLLKRLIDKFDPKLMLLVWDSKGPTTRHLLYPEYKKNRGTMPLDLAEQKAYIQEFADLIGLKQIELQGIEADDLMFSFSQKLEKVNIKSIIVSSDKDMTQMLNEYILLYDPFKNKFIKKEDVEQKFGFPIDKLPFYYALVGDASDNIPGARGIGPKQAQVIVQQFHSIKDLLERIDLLKERQKKLILESKENIILSETLFKLQYYDINLNSNTLVLDKNNWKNAFPLFKKLELPNYIFENKENQQIALSELNKKYQFICINSMKDLRSLCTLIREHGKFSIDTEGTALNPLSSRLVGISICIKEGSAFYIPLGHISDDEQLNTRQVLKELKPILEDSTIEKYLHHSKYDALVFHKVGIQLRGIKFDTLIAAHLLLPVGDKKGLKYLSEKFFKEKMFTFEEVVKANGYKNFAQVPLQLATIYSAADAHQTMKLVNFFSRIFKSEKKLSSLFENIEMPLVNVLLDMERQGIYLDRSHLDKIKKNTILEIDKLKAQIHEQLGENWKDKNLNSPKQVQDILFSYLKLAPIKKTTTGAYSTDNEVLTKLSKFHELPKLINKYRELFKLKSTYLEGLQKNINILTGLIHTSFNQTEVVTGRLSSTLPNLQNIPLDKLEIRSAFKPRDNNVFLAADYSQIELRVLAYLSQDQILLDAFNKNEDIHSLTASNIFSVPINEITREQRQIGKRVNFGILYGQTALGLSNELDIPKQTAAAYIEKYFTKYSGVRKWMESVINFAKTNGYVETIFGRRRYLPDINNLNKSIYELNCRMAINTMAQGTAADLMKLGMVELHKQFQLQNLSAKLILQIHDEILVEVSENELLTVKQLVLNVLSNIVKWNISLKVNILNGYNWQEVTK